MTTLEGNALIRPWKKRETEKPLVMSSSLKIRLTIYVYMLI